MKEQITYFEKSGIENTRDALRTAKDYADKNRVGKIVIASTTGCTALAAADFFRNSGAKIFAVGIGSYGWSKDKEKQQEMSEMGIKAKVCTHFLDIGIANVLRQFSQGFKVIFEIAQTAAETGFVSCSEEFIAVAGSGFGSDTVLVLRRQPKNFDVLKILCFPVNEHCSAALAGDSKF